MPFVSPVRIAFTDGAWSIVGTLRGGLQLLPSPSADAAAEFIAGVAHISCVFVIGRLSYLCQVEVDRAL